MSFDVFSQTDEVWRFYVIRQSNNLVPPPHQKEFAGVFLNL